MSEVDAITPPAPPVAELVLTHPEPQPVVDPAVKALDDLIASRVLAATKSLQPQLEQSQDQIAKLISERNALRLPFEEYERACRNRDSNAARALKFMDDNRFLVEENNKLVDERNSLNLQLEQTKRELAQLQASPTQDSP